jgi:catechol 2,3-dioxygenase-like lactoylglutathione lyase family enzyme
VTDPAPLLAAIDHVQLGMPAGGEAEARSFYCDILGLREIAKPPVLAARGGCWFAARGVAIHLGVEPDFRPSPKSHPGFVVDSLTAARERLVAAGVRIIEDDATVEIDRCYIRDPFGNRIELIDATDAGFSAAR